MFNYLIFTYKFKSNIFFRIDKMVVFRFCVYEVSFLQK